MFKSIAAGALLCLFASAALPAESIYSEQDKLIRANRAVTTLGPDLFGDKVNLYNGTLEFVQTDVSLPGNNALPVALGRRLTTGAEIPAKGVFGDWDIEIPHMHGIFSNSGWTTQAGGTARCSTYGVPPVVNTQGGGMWNPEEYWHGNFMYLPGKGSEEILLRDASNSNYPTASFGYTSTFTLTTKSMWSIKCIPMADGVAGEGFLAVTPDGTQYRFDKMM